MPDLATAIERRILADLVRRMQAGEALSGAERREVQRLARKHGRGREVGAGGPDRNDAERKSAARQKARDLQIPEPQHPRRRAACRLDLPRFLRTYLPATFTAEFSGDQLDQARNLQDAVLTGQDHADAAFRGGGKTSLCKGTVVWCLVYAHSTFPIWFGATGAAAQRNLRNLRRVFETSEELAEDFPEVCVPVRSLERSSRRAIAQTAYGQPTFVEWRTNYIRLPQIDLLQRWDAALLKTIHWDGKPRLRAATCDSLEGGGVRGWVVDDQRPTLLLFDDIETRDTVKSPTATADLETLVENDCAGLAGQLQQLTRFWLGTIMTSDSLTAKMTDPAQKPGWGGRRYRFLKQEPAAAKTLWAEYVEGWQDQERGAKWARAFYLANRAAMDAGAEVSWPAGYVPSDEASALERYYRSLAKHGLRYVACELQNDPSFFEASEASGLTVQQVCRRANGLPRGRVPAEANMLTAFLDLGQERLHWCLTAWDQRTFDGWVVDYGTTPARHDLAVEWPGLSPEAAIARGIVETQTALSALRLVRPDGIVLSLAKGAIDCGSQLGKLALRACRKWKAPNLWLPAKGSAARLGEEFNDQQPKEGELSRGDHWRFGRLGAGVVPVLTHDANHWKSFVHRRLKTPVGEPGALTLFGEREDMHRLFAEHVTAESEVEVWTQTKHEFRWQPKPNRANHWLDCLSGTAFLASMLGARLRPQTTGKAGAESASAGAAGPGPRDGAAPARGRAPKPKPHRQPARRARTSRWDE